MNLELSELFGGFDTLAGKSKTLTVSGGFTKNNKHVEHNVVIGDITKNFVKNKMIEWDTFKSTYYNNGKLDQKHYANFLNTMNDIFPLPIYTTNENELLFLVSNIYKAKENNTMKRHLDDKQRQYIESDTVKYCMYCSYSSG